MGSGLVGVDRIADYLAWRYPRARRILNGTPVVLIDRGQPLEDRMRQHHINMDARAASASCRREADGLSIVRPSAT